MDQTPHKPAVAAIILAAGGSRRMGQPKQLLPMGGQPMVRRVAEMTCSAGLAQVIVVVGAQAEAIGKALADLPLELVINEAWAEGMSASLRAGLTALRPDIQAALIVLADQPTLTAQLLRDLAARYAATGAPVIAPYFEGQRGNPVLFDRSLFPRLMAVEGDRGGRAVLQDYDGPLEQVDVTNAAILEDIDTQEDYDKFTDRLSHDLHH